MSLQSAWAKSHRESVVNEYQTLKLATRRALHELELSNLEVRAAELRRKASSRQLEMAKSGLLGVDCEEDYCL